MRRLAVMLALLLVTLPGVSRALDRQGMATIGGSFGASFMGGAPSLTFGDARPRLSARAQTRYLLDNHWSASVSLGYAWNSYQGRYDLSTKETWDTLLIVTPLELGIMYSFGADYRAHRPYIGAQVGLYRWEFVSNAPFGVRQTVRDEQLSQDLDRTYLGFGFVVGHEFLWRDNSSFNLELGWHHIPSNDTQRFNTAESQRFLGAINLVEIRTGFSYYFSVAGTKHPTVAAKPLPEAHKDTTAAAPPAVRGTQAPRVERESIQIVPEATDATGGAATAPKTPAAPGAPAPAPPPTPAPSAAPAPPVPPPAPAANPAPADTTAGKKP
ncbi:MAG TPA: hypothetical protein VMS93_04750 [Candidatus Saccharimonadales bacterium]|nr:hypothetical protein [Candidatus Saccharimonadales bacterium]